MRRKAEPVTTTELCVYGCGNLAKYKSASNKFLCESSPNKCTINRAKNSKGATDAYLSGKRPDGKTQYKNLPDDSKRKMLWNKGLTISENESIAKYTATRQNNIKTGKTIAGSYGVAKHPEMRWKRNKFDWIDSFGNKCVLESKHEAHVAKILDEEGIRWIRPSALKLSDGRSYEPDFFLIDYEVYLDPKSLWCKNAKANQTPTGRKIIEYQEAQLKKIELCIKELSVKIIILLSTDKRSYSWNGILDIIEEMS